MGILDIGWKGIVQETLMITSFVILMMLLIEFVNVLTRGKLVKKLSKNTFYQVLTGTLLGLLPGCIGTFTAVSLYTHRLLSFGALVATMIATSGDEAYFMLALIPREALLIFAILSVVAIITGVIVDKVFKKQNFAAPHDFSFEIHEKDCGETPSCLFSFKNFTFLPKRLYLILIVLSVVTLTLVGWVGHSHSDKLMFSLPDKETSQLVEISDVESEEVQIDSHEGHNHETEHQHSEECDHETEANVDQHDHDHGIDWVKLSILLTSLLSLIIIVFSSDHFITKHLWDHVLKKHLLKIFLWVFGTMIAISVLLNFSEFGVWIYENMFFILIIAVLLGLVPQSGPHLVFVVLFIQGVIPFSILLASSIVQDGHGSLPLLAESKKSFVFMKIINILVGLLIGAIGLLLNF